MRTALQIALSTASLYTAHSRAGDRNSGRRAVGIDALSCCGQCGSYVGATALPIICVDRNSWSGDARRPDLHRLTWKLAPHCRPGSGPAGVGVGGHDARFAPGLIAEPRFAPLVAPRRECLLRYRSLTCIDRKLALRSPAAMQEVTTAARNTRIRHLACVFVSFPDGKQSLRCAKRENRRRRLFEFITLTC